LTQGSQFRYAKKENEIMAAKSKEVKIGWDLADFWLRRG
jgi:hypothetical protein